MLCLFLLHSLTLLVRLFTPVIIVWRIGLLISLSGPFMAGTLTHTVEVGPPYVKIMAEHHILDRKLVQFPSWASALRLVWGQCLQNCRWWWRCLSAVVPAHEPRWETRALLYGQQKKNMTHLSQKSQRCQNRLPLEYLTFIYCSASNCTRSAL